MAATSHDQTSCYLTDSIPRELRDKIYEFVLYAPAADGTVTIPKRKRRDRQYSVLAFLRTCKQIHYEAQYIFYEINNVRFETSPLLWLWPLELRDKAAAIAINRARVAIAAKIKVLTVSVWPSLDSERSRGFVLAHRLKKFPNVVCLHLELVSWAFAESVVEEEGEEIVRQLGPMVTKPRLERLKVVKIVLPHGKSQSASRKCEELEIKLMEAIVQERSKTE